MSHENQIMHTTVELVSAYMHSLNCSAMFIDDDSAEQYAKFVETIYKKVEELTTSK